MIELQGVRKRFGEQVVLDGVDFEVREGETLALRSSVRALRLNIGTSNPSTMTRPLCALSRPSAMRMLVVFPAPLWPRKP